MAWTQLHGSSQGLGHLGPGQRLQHCGPLGLLTRGAASSSRAGPLGRLLLLPPKPPALGRPPAVQQEGGPARGP
eukprot:15012808-Alexandrium_andersonii.AAC.1